MPEQPVEIQSVIRRSLQGDQTAYAELYDAFVEGVYRLCFSLLLNREDAEDVMQESFVYAFKNLYRYDPERSAFKTWLYTIAISRCRNVYRRNKLPCLDIHQLLQKTPHSPNSELPEAAYARQTVQAKLEEALRGLSPLLREAVVLRYGHALTYREIAEVMDCPPKTAESRVRLAHDALRSLLQTEGTVLLQELLSFES